GFYHTLRYAMDIAIPAVRAFRRPLSLFLFIWMLAWATAQISETIRTALSPLCVVPGISSSLLCTTQTFESHSLDTRPNISGDQSRKPQQIDFPELMRIQEGTFDHLMSNAIGGVGLSLEVRKAELVTSDLSLLVRNSDLKSRDLLADLLDAFVKDAKKTAKGLTRLGAKVGGAVDHVTAVNSYTMQIVQEAHANTQSRFALVALIPAFRGTLSREMVLEAFTDAMETLSAAIARLIIEAEISLADLTVLEEDLAAIQAIVVREFGSVTREKDELLAHLWTVLGGNRQEVRSYDDKLALLHHLGEYRKRALAHIIAALQTLNMMNEDMEDLRERVAAPDLTRGRVPLTVHLESIQHGLERLKEKRVQSKEIGEALFRKEITIE
ncbi:hypothetical protein CONPUDRAFT_61543, partial [Coniophora puteana RWD-64-598 SS2]